MIPSTDKPTSVGWYWWKASPTTPPKDVKVTQQDIDHAKYARWGGEWHKFPTFSEAAELRSRVAEIESHYRAQSERMKRYESLFTEFVQCMVEVKSSMFTPKKKINDFLEEMKKKSI